MRGGRQQTCRGSFASGLGALGAWVAHRSTPAIVETFVRNRLPGTLAIDFLTVPTATFGVLYVFFVLSLERRRIPATSVDEPLGEAVGRHDVGYARRDR